MSYPLISNDLYVQRSYEAMRDNGQSHNMAEMLATRRGPALETDTRFMTGWGGPQYSMQLARYPGDPEGWVSHPDDYKRVLKQRGWGCKGSINVKAADVEVPDDVPYRPADDLIDEQVRQIVDEHGGDVTPSERSQLREDVIKEASGNNDASPVGSLVT